MPNVLFLIKPNETRKQLEILKKISEAAPIQEVTATILSKSVVEELYAQHRDEYWFERNVGFLSDRLVLAAKVSVNSVEEALEIKTQLRSEYSNTENHPSDNAIHCSDSVENAERELKILNNLFRETV